MYLCVQCDQLFEEPKYYVETHGFSYPPYEEWKGCPYCGGVYVGTFECSVCGNWIKGDYVEICNEVICEDCYQFKSVDDQL